MKIVQIEIDNFRNLSGLDVQLNPDLNFLVGENEMGKSNFLDLLDNLFARRSFTRTDYYDERKPIEVKFTISLTEEEIGAFEDYFDPTNHAQANFIAKQENADEPLLFYRAENYTTDPKEISAIPFRRLNYIKYSSLHTPKEELSFERERGVGKFFNYLVRSTISEDGDANGILNNAVLDPILKRINSMLEKIKPFQKMGIGTFADQDHQADLLSRVLLLRNGDAFDITKSGQGTQFTIMLILSILEKLIERRSSRWWKDSTFISSKHSIDRKEVELFLQREGKKWDDIASLVTIKDDTVSFCANTLTLDDEVGNGLKSLIEKKGATIILGLDEPEVHLHPYSQRSLIKYIASILGNNEKDFKLLLKELLELDEISGQAIVVSHSPNILMDEYKQIVRFYKLNGEIKSISGVNLKIDPQLEKQLLYQFPSIKEAFFSKCVVVVEGKTEIGAMNVWKDTHLGDADDLGISIIGADGCPSVEPIVRLLNELKIPNVSVIDRDDNNPSTYSHVNGLFFTKGRDFEEELFDEIYTSQQNCEVLYSILSYKDSNLQTSRPTNVLHKIANTYGIPETWDTNLLYYQFSNPEVKNNPNLLKVMFIAFMSFCKSLAFGRFLALRTTLIPSIYCTVLDEAKRKAEQVDDPQSRH